MRKKGLIFCRNQSFCYLGLVNKQICNENTTDHIKSLSVNCFQYFILSLYLKHYITELSIVDHHVVDVKGLIYKPAQVAVIHWVDIVEAERIVCRYVLVYLRCLPHNDISSAICKSTAIGGQFIY